MPDETKDALTLLDDWCRKHYRYKIEGNGFCQPGDGHTVTLTAAGRTVQVSDYELVTGDEDDDTPSQWPTLDELVKEAIQRWHADTTPKHFRVYFHADYLTFEAQHWHGDKYMAHFEATSEDEAKKKLHDKYPPHENQPEIIQVWEVHANGHH